MLTTLLIIQLAITIALVIINNRKSMERKAITRACSKIQATAKMDPNRSLMDSHKILVNTIQQELFPKKKLNAAKVLNKVCKHFPEEKELWRFHRMRNQAAHEDDFNVSSNQAQQARQVFQKCIRALESR